jgi:uncharacterized protein
MIQGDDDSSFVKIPLERLPSDVLEGIVSEFILREGTEYGAEHSLAEKVEQVRGQLAKGIVTVVYDPKHETCTIIESWKLKQLEV